MFDLSWFMFVLLTLVLWSLGISGCGWCWLVCGLIVLLLISSFNGFEIVCVYLIGLLIALRFGFGLLFCLILLFWYWCGC